MTGPGATHDRGDGLRTPPLGHGQSAELSGKIQGPGTLQGWSRVFSEPLQDILELLLHGVAVRDFGLNASRNGALDTRLPRGAGLPVFEVRENYQVGPADAICNADTSGEPVDGECNTKCGSLMILRNLYSKPAGRHHVDHALDLRMRTGDKQDRTFSRDTTRRSGRVRVVMER